MAKLHGAFFSLELALDLGFRKALLEVDFEVDYRITHGKEGEVANLASLVLAFCSLLYHDW